MKPRILPKSLGDKWQTWPTLEELCDRHKGEKLHAVRAMLAPVPCCRCKDNTVRYAPDLAEAALSGALSLDDDEEEGDNEIGDEIRSGKMVDVMLVLRELGRGLADARKEKNDTIKAMESPLKIGVAMMTEAMDVLVKRCAHYEAIHDEMIAQRERAASLENERLMSVKKLEQTQEMRRNMFGLLREQVPAMVSQFQSATEGKVALALVRSFEGPVIDAMLEHDVFTPEQQQMIAKLRKPSPPPAAPAADAQPPIKKDDLAAAS